MDERTENIRLMDSTANPAPLGLCGFGMTTLLLNLHNVGLFGMDSMIMAMGIFFGGLAQAVTGKMEWRKNNLFGTVAFSSYGLFWIILITLQMLPKLGLGEAPTPISMGWFLTLWGIFSIGLWIATFNMNKMTQVLFATVALLFFLLATADFTGNETIKLIGGIDGVICGSLALYIALATVINTTRGTEILPIR